MEKVVGQDIQLGEQLHVGWPPPPSPAEVKQVAEHHRHHNLSKVQVRLVVVVVVCRNNHTATMTILHFSPINQKPITPGKTIGLPRRPLKVLTLLISTCYLLLISSPQCSSIRPRITNKLTSPFHQLAPDAFVDPTEFIRLRQFIPETHQVVTRDDYILTLHRIVNPLVPAHLCQRLKPVLLNHGIFTSSFNFLMASDRNNDRPRFHLSDLTPENYNQEEPLAPQAAFSWHRIAQSIWEGNWAWPLDATHQPKGYLSDSLAFELANRGYDVWLANARGSTYSLNHTRLDYRHDWRYWDFSFHEMGLYDLPAQIDYILQLRRRKSLAYAGHSMGNTVMFVLQSLQPEWSRKVRPFIAMAPVAFIPHMYHGSWRTLAKLLRPIMTTTQLNRILKGQLLPNSEATKRALDMVCVPKWSTALCNMALTVIFGASPKQTNSSRTPVIAHHLPEGTSVLNLLHFVQLVETGQFSSFNFGPNENTRRYGSAINPTYPIENINSTDIAFMWARADPLACPADVALTRRKLRVALMDDYVIPEDTWGHSDFVYANGIAKQVNRRAITLIDRYRFVDDN